MTVRELIDALEQLPDELELLGDSVDFLPRIIVHLDRKATPHGPDVVLLIVEEEAATQYVRDKDGEIVLEAV